MWSMTATMTNTCMPRAWSKRLCALLAPLALAGCVHDTASYLIDVDDHAITLARQQAWFWQDTLSIDVTALRKPHCQGGGRIEAVPIDSEAILYRAPDEYAEPLFILRLGERYFAISTESCRMQVFAQAPETPGEELGRFDTRDGAFRFHASAPTNG